MAMVALMRRQQRQAHENPVIFYSVIIGSIGPVLAITVPPIRERYGYRPAEMIPTSYPCSYKTPSRVLHVSKLPFWFTVPNRPRRPTQGYEDP